MTRNQTCLWVTLSVVLVGLAVFAFGGLNGCGGGQGPLTGYDSVMGGIPVKIIAWGSDEEALKAAIEAAFARIRQIDARMSDYKEDSEVSQIGKAAGGKAVKVSDDTFAVIKKAKEYYERTGGAFDVTVRPLLVSWRSRDERDKNPAEIPANNAPPADEEIARTLELVGSDKIILDEANKTVMLARAGMSIDLGAIAKGYAVDEAVRVLKSRGIANCLVAVGGEVYAAGNRIDGGPWGIGIHDPAAKEPDAILQDKELGLSNRGVSTSGDYERYVVIGGKRYNHIFDPRTGRPVEGLHSLTVVASNCTEADALGTTLTVMGTRQGLDLIRSYPGVEFYAIPDCQTPGFARYIRPTTTDR